MDHATSSFFFFKTEVFEKTGLSGQLDSRYNSTSYRLSSCPDRPALLKSPPRREMDHATSSFFFFKTGTGHRARWGS